MYTYLIYPLYTPESFLRSYNTEWTINILSTIHNATAAKIIHQLPLTYIVIGILICTGFELVLYFNFTFYSENADAICSLNINTDMKNINKIMNQ